MIHSISYILYIINNISSQSVFRAFLYDFISLFFLNTSAFVTPHDFVLCFTFEHVFELINRSILKWSYELCFIFKESLKNSRIWYNTRPTPGETEAALSDRCWTGVRCLDSLWHLDDELWGKSLITFMCNLTAKLIPWRTTNSYLIII